MNVQRIEDMLGRLFTVRDLVEGYVEDKKTNSVKGYGGRLDIRPAYQRNFRYDTDQQREVMNTIAKKFPLNVMYWVKTGDDTYEVLDGQQRTLSICEFIYGKDGKGNGLSIVIDGHKMTFANLRTQMKSVAEDILDYPLDVYVCEGTDKEKLAWFRVINTAGAVLTEQELRNATYAGAWVMSAKAYFSQANSKGVVAADKQDGKAAPLMAPGCKWNAQEYLEVALSWIADRDGVTIEDYMSTESGKENNDATELWMYFNSVISWVRAKFPQYRKAGMQGKPWGKWYNQYQNHKLDNNIIAKDAVTIESEIQRLIADDEVEAKLSGVYQYIIDGKETHLSLRKFDDTDIEAVYEEQGHRCPHCDKHINGHTYPQGQTTYALDEMEADHIIPWRDGGKSVKENLSLLCIYHNRHKGAK